MSAERFVDEILTHCAEQGYVFQPSHSITITMIFVNNYRKFLCPDADLESMADLFAHFLPLIENRIRNG